MGIAYRDHRIIRMEFLIYKLIGFSDGNNLVYAFAHFDVASHQLCLIAYHAYDGYLGGPRKDGAEDLFGFNQIGYLFLQSSLEASGFMIMIICLLLFVGTLLSALTSFF